jgi:uroporphyrinogen-III synthase
MRVAAFESRREKEMAELIRRHGGEPVSAPSMRELPSDENPAALELARRLREHTVHVAIFLTGVGTRFLAAAVAKELPREALGRLLSKIHTVARGPKPVVALRELGVTPTVTVPEPNTWKEVLAAIDERLDVRGRIVAVQEYGQENPELIGGLTTRGATVLRVPVYRWALPEDTRPLEAAIRAIVAGELGAALFTSATQVEHLFRVAGAAGGPLRSALGRLVVASIGPVCSEALRRQGVEPDLEPEHPKMGHLVRAAADRARALLDRKAGSR